MVAGVPTLCRHLCRSRRRNGWRPDNHPAHRRWRLEAPWKWQHGDHDDSGDSRGDHCHEHVYCTDHDRALTDLVTGKVVPSGMTTSEISPGSWWKRHTIAT